MEGEGSLPTQCKSFHGVADYSHLAASLASSSFCRVPYAPRLMRDSISVCQMEEKHTGGQGGGEKGIRIHQSQPPWGQAREYGDHMHACLYKVQVPAPGTASAEGTDRGGALVPCLAQHRLLKAKLHGRSLEHNRLISTTGNETIHLTTAHPFNTHDPCVSDTPSWQQVGYRKAQVSHTVSETKKSSCAKEAVSIKATGRRHGASMRASLAFTSAVCPIRCARAWAWISF